MRKFSRLLQKVIINLMCLIMLSNLTVFAEDCKIEVNYNKDQANLMGIPFLLSSLSSNEEVEEILSDEDDLTLSKISIYKRAILENKIRLLSSKDQRVCNKVNAVIKKYIKSDMKKTEKVKQIHDYLVNNIQYDTRKKVAEASYTVYGALINKKSVCQGYSESFQLFMDVLGIESKIVYGKSKDLPHAWNMVKLEDKKWYHVDVTWDDPIMNTGDNILRHYYFLVTDTQLKKDHEWDKKQYPVCKGTKYLYYPYKNQIIKKKADYEKAFLKQYKKGKKTIVVLYPEKGKPDQKSIFKVVNSFGEYPTFRLGKYTVYTVVIK